MDLYVIRHGRTEANAAGVLLGRADPDLDEVGRIQAAELAAAIPPMDRILSSPLKRCRDTAAALGPDVEIEPRLVEVDYGIYDLMPTKSVPADVWTSWTSDLSFVPEGGESMMAMGERVREFLDELTADPQGDRVALVTHVFPIKAALAWALGAGGHIAVDAHVSQASVTRVRTSGGRVNLLEFNSTCHLS